MMLFYFKRENSPFSLFYYLYTPAHLVQGCGKDWGRQIEASISDSSAADILSLIASVYLSRFTETWHSFKVDPVRQQRLTPGQRTNAAIPRGEPWGFLDAANPGWQDLIELDY